MAGMKTDNLKNFLPKEEVMRIPFDPNIRHRLPTLPHHIYYRAMYGHIPQTEAMSSYCAVNHKGINYHLFNAKRMPVGRMAVMIA